MKNLYRKKIDCKAKPAVAKKCFQAGQNGLRCEAARFALWQLLQSSEAIQRNDAGDPISTA